MLQVREGATQPEDHMVVISPLTGCSMLSQAVQPSAGKESPLWDLIQSLQERSSWNRAKPFLTFEVRYIQATSLGVPLEISKYYQSINGIDANGEQPNYRLWIANDFGRSTSGQI